MFVWPDGSVTGSERWDALGWLITEKPAESDFYAAGHPTKAGWAVLQGLFEEHYKLVNPPEPEQSDAELADMEAEADAQAAASRAEQPKRGPGRPRKEA